MNIAFSSAQDKHVEQMTAIYNHYVVNTAATFDDTPVTVENRRKWFFKYSYTGPHRIVVAERDERILGYALSMPYVSRKSISTAIETCVFLDPNHLGNGIGTRLYDYLFGSLFLEDLHRAYASITLPNNASVALHEKLGFHSVGVCQEVGRKFGKYWDVEWYEKELGE